MKFCSNNFRWNDNFRWILRFYINNLMRLKKFNFLIFLFFENIHIFHQNSTCKIEQGENLELFYETWISVNISLWVLVNSYKLLLNLVIPDEIILKCNLFFGLGLNCISKQIYLIPTSLQAKNSFWALKWNDFLTT